MMNLYRELLMDHYRHPRNYGKLSKADFSSGEYNPSCGDSVTFEGRIENNILTAMAFTGKGCVISQATASLLTEYCLRKSLADILAISKEDVVKLIGIELGPTRLMCALLPLQALQEGVLNYIKRKKDAQSSEIITGDS
jgi:nitrogen fixation NifU-like protein